MFFSLILFLYCSSVIVFFLQISWILSVYSLKYLELWADEGSSCFFFMVFVAFMKRPHENAAYFKRTAHQSLFLNTSEGRKRKECKVCLILCVKQVPPRIQPRQLIVYLFTLYTQMDFYSWCTSSDIQKQRNESKKDHPRLFPISERILILILMYVFVQLEKRRRPRGLFLVWSALFYPINNPGGSIEVPAVCIYDCWTKCLIPQSSSWFSPYGLHEASNSFTESDLKMAAWTLV